MTAPTFASLGKQVLRNGSEHVADAVDPETAVRIADALNEGWQLIATAPRVRNVDILVCGGTYIDDDDWLGTPHPLTGCAIVSFYDGYVTDDGHAWKGQPCHSHDEFRFHAPAYWRPLPAAPVLS